MCAYSNKILGEFETQLIENLLSLPYNHIRENFGRLLLFCRLPIVPFGRLLFLSWQNQCHQRQRD